MRKLFFVHLLINLYLLTLVQPILPVVEYLVNYQYIVDELCENRDKPVLTCNGKCYLGDQIQKQLPTESESQEITPPSVEFQKFVESDLKLKVHSEGFDITDKSDPAGTRSLHDTQLISSHWHPPQV